MTSTLPFDQSDAQARLAEAALAESPGPGRDGEAPDADLWAANPSVVMLAVGGWRLEAHWSPASDRVRLSDPDRRLSVLLSPAQARALGRQLAAAADEGEGDRL